MVVRAGITFAGDQVQRLSSGFGQDGGMRFVDKVGDGFAQPVIAAGVAVVFVHPLLDDRPGASPGKKKGVVIKLVAVLDGGAIHLGGHAAGINQRCRVERNQLAPRSQSRRESCAKSCPCRRRQTSPGRFSSPFDAFFESAAEGGGHAAGVPVKAQNTAEGLEPVGMGKPPEHLLRADIRRRWRW